MSDFQKMLVWFSLLLMGLVSAAALVSFRRAVLTQQSLQPEDGSLRIVSLAPNLTEILFAMGLGEQVVGVSSDSNFPPEAARCKKVGTFWNPDAEAVLAVRPTLVITLGFEQQATLAALLERSGCRTLRLDVDTIPQLYKAIEAIGSAAGCPQAAEDLVCQIAEGLEAFRGKASNCARRAVWILQRQPLRAAGKKTYFTELLEIAGARNAVESSFYSFPLLTEEHFLSCDAEVIFETADTPADLERQKATAKTFYRRFRGIPAVEQGRVYVLNGDLLCRLGPRIPLALEEIVRCLCGQAEGAL